MALDFAAFGARLGGTRAAPPCCLRVLKDHLDLSWLLVLNRATDGMELGVTATDVEVK